MRRFFIEYKRRGRPLSYYARDYRDNAGGVMTLTGDQKRAYRYADPVKAEAMAANIRRFWGGRTKVREA